MKNSDIKSSEMALELAIRLARGWDADPNALRAEYGFSRATAYRWLKRLRDVQNKLKSESSKAMAA
jgi:hypothetical protein